MEIDELGFAAQRLRDLKDKKASLNKEIAAMNEIILELEASMMETLDNSNINLARAGNFTVSITENVVPTVVNWDLFDEYVVSTNSPFLYERRCSARPWRELQSSGVLVPGTEPFTKKGLSLRKAPKK